jgi:hypothetical protein
MRKITKESVKAFFNAERYFKNNTRTEVLPNVTILYLHNNPIAYRYNDPKKTLSIQNCGWFSNTTKERLNGILDYIGKPRIYQKNFSWFLDGEKWNGKYTDIKI